jgi:NADPH2 dehydrogenase
MAGIFSDYILKEHKIKNRVVLPPMVTPHYTGQDGIVTERSIRHYTDRAAGGPGIVIVEATAVQKDGRLAPYQLGLWDDSFIPGLAAIASVIKAAGALALIQIHHAGLVTPESVFAVCKGPSADENNPRSQELTVPEIEAIREYFIAAALRAQRAGFDGIELHGAHGYLLNQFASSLFNKREDEYGSSMQGRMKLAIDIIKGVRKAGGPGLFIGYRMGANSPLLENGIEIAKYLEQAGIDLLHVSHGGSLQNLPRPPKEFDYNWIVYSGISVKAEVSLPVIVVNEIKTAARASFLVENNLADFVALGRTMLADPEWTNHVKNDLPVNICSSCKPKCRWYESSDLCPAIQRLAL